MMENERNLSNSGNFSHERRRGKISGQIESSSSSQVKNRNRKRNMNDNVNSLLSPLLNTDTNINSSCFRPTSSHAELFNDLVSLFVPEYGDFLHCTKCLTSFSDFSHLVDHFKNCGPKSKTKPRPPPSKSKPKSESNLTSSLTEETIEARKRRRIEKIRPLSPSPKLGRFPDTNRDSDNSLDFNLDPSKFLIPESCISFFPVETQVEEHQTTVCTNTNTNTNEKSYNNMNNNNYDDNDDGFNMDNITIKSESPSDSFEEEPFIKTEPEIESEYENADMDVDWNSEFTTKNVPISSTTASSSSNFLQSTSTSTSPHSVVYKISKDVKDRIKVKSIESMELKNHSPPSYEKTPATKKKSWTRTPKATRKTKTVSKPKSKPATEKEKPEKKELVQKSKSTKKTTTIQNLQCSYECGMTFKSLGVLTRHEVSRKNNGHCPQQYDGPGFKCDHPGCNKILCSIRSLGTHKKCHWPDEARKCPICGIILSTPLYIKNHVKFTHQNVKELVCDHCGKTFAKGTQLTDHLRTHSKERPYLCPLCGQTFALRTGLRRHQIVHTKIKRFTCDYCHKKFTGNQMRRFHMARKTCLKNGKTDQNQEKEPEGNQNDE